MFSPLPISITGLTALLISLAPAPSMPPPSAQSRSTDANGKGPARTRPDVERLKDLVREALARHPTMKVATFRAAAADEVPSRVGSLPDPWLGVAGQNLRIDTPLLRSSPMSGIQVDLVQRFPGPGKLRRRRAAAQATADALDRTTDLTASHVILAVRRAYWELHFAERAVDITNESEQVFSTLVDVTIERYGVGMGAQQDTLQAQVAHSRLRADLKEREQALQTARRQLNSAVGRPPTARFGATQAPTLEPLPPRRELHKRLAKANPQLLERRAQLLAADRRLAEARRDRWPDFQIGLGWRFRAVVAGDPSNGADMFVASLGISLPLWMRRKQGARVRESSLARKAAEAAVAATELAVETELDRLVDIIMRLDEQIRVYRKEIIPQASGALDASIADYQVGKVGFVSVLNNWEVDLTAQLTLERLLTERAVRMAELDALTQVAPK